MKKFIVVFLILSLIAIPAFARSVLVKKAITDENQFTNSISLTHTGAIVIEDTGVISATFTLQVRAESGDAWVDSDTFTTAGRWYIHNPSGFEFRLGVKTGDFTSGTATVSVEGE